MLGFYDDDVLYWDRKQKVCAERIFKFLYWLCEDGSPFSGISFVINVELPYNYRIITEAIRLEINFEVVLPGADPGRGSQLYSGKDGREGEWIY